MQRARWIPVVLFLVVPACGDDDDGDATDAGPRSDGSIVLDSGGRDLGADASGPDMATEDASSADSGASDGAPADAGADGAPADAGDADGGTRPDGGSPMDDCTLDADCPSGICWPSPDGARRCTMRIEPPLDGCEGGFEPCCLRDADCVDGPGGRCAAFTFGYCGGAAPPPGNTCRYDGCATDADCGGGLCLPPGAIGNLNAACVAAPCRSPADCTRRAGGQCVLARTGGFCPSPAVYCVYDGDPCRTDADCRTPDRAQICVPNPDGHGTRCEDPPPPPP